MIQHFWNYQPPKFIENNKTKLQWYDKYTYLQSIVKRAKYDKDSTRYDHVIPT